MLVKMEKAALDVVYAPRRRVSTRALLFALLLTTVLLMVYFRHSLPSEPTTLRYVQHQVKFKGRLPFLPEEDPYVKYGDRIEAQLSYAPEVEPHSALIYQQAEYDSEQTMWMLDECPVKCMMSNMDVHMMTADALIFTPDFIDRVPITKKPSQSWFLQLSESPVNTPTLSDFDGKINYTVSYRWDADFVAPYGRYVPFAKPKTLLDVAVSRKKNEVAWFVSHCLTVNHRFEYAKKLGQHINVTIFGECGEGQKTQKEMDELLNKDFKFYLAFENSNCNHYITEKFFENALSHDIIPIVMGASKEDYLKVAPPNSFIHVEDFADAEHLAVYLKYLSTNPHAYNEYLAWKRLGRIEDSNLPCRICMFMQKPTPKLYEDIDTWWHGKGECLYGNQPVSPFLQ